MFAFRCCVVLLLFFEICRSEVIDENEYYKMPDLFTMDDFDSCLRKTNGLYCITDINLTTTKPSELWYQIKNFSAHTLKHYRHDILHKGICVTTTCNMTEDLNSTSESFKQRLSDCVNRNLEEMYELQGIVSVVYCEDKDSRPKYEMEDWIYVVVVCILFLFNVIGTFYHLKLMRRRTENGNRLLLCFSFIANWYKLMPKPKPKSDSGDNSSQSFRCIQGMRFLTMLAVIFSHVVLIIPHGYVRNPIKIEKPYSDPFMQLLYNGSLVVQTFLGISSFLMSYQFLKYTETHPTPKFRTYFLMIVQRWCRLTPIYAIILGYIVTINTKMSFGPQWRFVVMDEADVCRNYWWANLFYINNYIHGAHLCMPESWYLAADTQLFCIGAFIMMIVWKYPRSKKILLGTMLIISIIVPFVMTYMNGWYPIVPQSPEVFRNLFNTDPTFLNVYATLTGNLGGYTVGLIVGFVQYYYFEKNKITLKGKKWSVVILYAAFPTGVSLIISGAFFYVDDYTRKPLVEAAYTALYKVVWNFIICGIFLLGFVHKVEKFARGMVEWSGFQVLGRLTFIAFLLHTIPQRTFVGLLRAPFDVVEFNIISMFISSVTLTYFIAWPICIMVEIPFKNLQDLLFKKKGELKKTDTELNTVTHNSKL